MRKKGGIRIRNHFSNWIITSVCLVFGLVFSVLIIMSFSAYGNKKINISDAESFVSAITKNSNSANSDVEYHLTRDITIDSTWLGKIYAVKNQSFETGAFFYGKLYGHGYTIKINDVVTAPIFEQICEDSRIEGINFKCDIMQVTNGVNELAFLVRENYGTINDISITGIEQDVMLIDFNNESPIAVSSLCVRNHENGAINHCAVNVAIKTANTFCQGENKLLGGNKWSCYFGAISAYCKVGDRNDDVEPKGINGARVRVNFAENFTPLLLRRYTVNNDVNSCIGYFVGYCNDYEKIGNESFYLIDGTFKDNVIDYVNLKDRLSNEKDKAPGWDHWSETDIFLVDKY